LSHVRDDVRDDVMTFEPSLAEETGDIYELLMGWDPHYGDRCSELVVIGLKMDQAKVRAALEDIYIYEEALVNPMGELKKCCKSGSCQRLAQEQPSEPACERGKGQDKWDELEDPFPVWEDPPNLADEDDDDDHGHGHGHAHGHGHGHSNKSKKR
jgi:hypothetical protein